MSDRLRGYLLSRGLLDPTTGKAIVVGGRPIIAGGSVNDPGDGDPGDGGGDDDGSTDDGDTGDGDPADDTGTGDDDGSTDKDDKDDRPSPEAVRRKREQEDRERRTRNRIAAAERRASDAEKARNRLQAELDKDKPESDRLRAELTDAEAENSRLRGVNRDLALQVAFFKNSKVDWVDGEDAVTIALRELGDIEVDDDGSVDPEEVRKVIARMTKEKSHLVRRSQPKSGAGVGGGKKQDNGAGSAISAQQAAMAPALRSRLVQPSPPQ